MDQPTPSLSPWPEFQLLEQRRMTAHCDSIAAMVAWLEQVGEVQDWPLQKVFALTLCADEALTNIVTHARPADGGALQIALLLGTVDEGAALCLADNGAAFDPTLQASAQLAQNLDEAEIGGHGLRLMRHYLQRFEYRRDEGWNWLLLGVSSHSNAG